MNDDTSNYYLRFPLGDIIEVTDAAGNVTELQYRSGLWRIRPFGKGFLVDLPLADEWAGIAEALRKRRGWPDGVNGDQLMVDTLSEALKITDDRYRQKRGVADG